MGLSRLRDRLLDGEFGDWVVSSAARCYVTGEWRAVQVVEETCEWPD